LTTTFSSKLELTEAGAGAFILFGEKVAAEGLDPGDDFFVESKIAQSFHKHTFKEILAVGASRTRTRAFGSRTMIVDAAFLLLCRYEVAAVAALEYAPIGEPAVLLRVRMSFGREALSRYDAIREDGILIFLFPPGCYSGRGLSGRLFER